MLISSGSSGTLAPMRQFSPMVTNRPISLVKTTLVFSPIKLPQPRNPVSRWTPCPIHTPGSTSVLAHLLVCPTAQGPRTVIPGFPEERSSFRSLSSFMDSLLSVSAPPALFAALSLFQYIPADVFLWLPGSLPTYRSGSGCLTWFL